MVNDSILLEQLTHLKQPSSAFMWTVIGQRKSANLVLIRTPCRPLNMQEYWTIDTVKQEFKRSHRKSHKAIGA